MDVTVVVPARNAAATIDRQLAALRDQSTDRGFEVVVADNGSTDGTRAVVDSFRRSWPELRWIDASTVRGSSHARNVGARAAVGRVLAFCDADDEVGPGWLDAVVDPVAPGVIVGGPLLLDRLNSPEVQRWRPPRNAEGLSRAMDFLPFVPSGNFAIERDAFLRLGGFREDYPKSHDVEFSWRAQLNGSSLVFAPAAAVQYRYRSTMSSAFSQAVKSGRATAQLYADYRNEGLTTRGVEVALRDLAWLVLRAYLVVDPRRRAVWMRRSGEAIGRVIGSCRFRVVYL